jgi:hypothetical protein
MGILLELLSRVRKTRLSWFPDHDLHDPFD